MRKRWAHNNAASQGGDKFFIFNEIMRLPGMFLLDPLRISRNALRLSRNALGLSRTPLRLSGSLFSSFPLSLFVFPAKAGTQMGLSAQHSVC